MELKEISLKFTAQELEALHYVLSYGIKQYYDNKPKPACDDWVDIAENIRINLPIKIRMNRSVL